MNLELTNRPIKFLLWKTYCLGISFFVASIAFSQTSLELKLEDDAQWENILPHKLSSDGTWISYGIRKDNNAYRTIVQNTVTADRFIVDSCYNSDFSNNGSWFVALNEKSAFIQIELKTGTKSITSNVKNYKLSRATGHLAFLHQKKMFDKYFLVVKDLETKDQIVFKNIIFYDFSPDGKYIALIKSENTSNAVVIFNLLNKTYHNSIKASQATEKLIWQPDSKGIAFWEENLTANDICWWKNIDIPHDIQRFGSKENGFSVSTRSRIPFAFSKKTERFFFQVEKVMPSNNYTQSTTNPEIWNTKDELVYPAFQDVEDHHTYMSYTISWEKSLNQWKVLGSNEASVGVFGMDGDYSYSFNFKDHLMASWDKDKPTPVMVYDIKNGTQKEIFKKDFATEISISPSGNFIAFFKEGQWIIFDAAKDKYQHITAHVPTSFENRNSRYIPPKSFSQPVWTEDEKNILIEDEMDVWLFNLKRNQAMKITDGKETKKSFSLYHLKNDLYFPEKVNSRYSGYSVNLKKGFILNMKDQISGATGYYGYSHSKGLYKIIEGNARFDNLRLSADGKKTIFTKEKFNLPTQILLLDSNKNVTTIYQSNFHYDKFQLGNEELVNYTTADGASLKGILYYPANFDSSKKYPLIVSIYETQSHNYHKFYAPTLYDRVGFNISNYTSEGYFVFLPDIQYQEGSPGKAALNCVMAGLDKILQLQFIDSEKIGLYGHSFGGYESLFLITQSNRFATVVAGAGVSNLLSFYLSMSWIWNRPQYTRIERHQWGMKKSYFDNPKDYYENSPINFVSNISTPILSWAGKEDSNINWEQHLEFYLALRKLNKEHIMLLYPREGHDLANPLNQRDLTLRIRDWFNYYLKNLDQPSWLKQRILE